MLPDAEGDRREDYFPAEPGPFWPGYYSVVFEDPDGTRLEMNYIPEEGWQAVAAAADAIAKRKSPL